MNPDRKKYVIATALLLLPVVGLGLGWGFIFVIMATTGSHPDRSDSSWRQFFTPIFQASFNVLARSIVAVAMKEMVFAR